MNFAHLSGMTHQHRSYCDVYSLPEETTSPAMELKFNHEDFDEIITFSDNTGFASHANPVQFENL